MQYLISSQNRFLWFVLLCATAIPPATTPIDEWTGWTMYSLAGAIVSTTFLLVTFLRRGPSKKDES